VLLRPRRLTPRHQLTVKYLSTWLFSGGAKGIRTPTLPAETGPDLRWLCVHVVTRVLCVLLICLGVLRDVTLLGGPMRRQGVGDLRKR
jgi:hypothetical protein